MASMFFADFARYLGDLEVNSSRLLMTDILATLLRELEEEETRPAMYMILGQIGSSYENKEFGMAEKMVIRAIAKLVEKDAEKVTGEYKRLGDLGLVVEQIYTPKKHQKLSVVEVHRRLVAIAAASGPGSQEEKVEKLTELMADLTVREAKYVARMVVGKLRLGFSDKTVLDALSVMANGDKSSRKKLDAAYQVMPDVGRLAADVKRDGLEKAVAGVKPMVGVPVVPALCQRLNEYQEIMNKMKDVAVEKKYDGTRVQIHFKRKDNLVKTFTRNLEETSEMFPELTRMGDWVEADELILDCEAIGFDSKTSQILSFQLTITRKRKHGIQEASKQVPLKFFVFDILALNGESMLHKPYWERREILKKIIKPNKTVEADEYIRCDDPSEIQRWHDQFLKDKYEGVVVKKWDGNYMPGRQGWNWVKIKEAQGKQGKLRDTLDLVVMGYYRGRGKRNDFGLGAFLVGVVRDEKVLTVAKIGTGLTDEQFRELKIRLDSLVELKKPEPYEVNGVLEPDVWVSPKLVVEVAADEITKSPTHTAGVALRFPRLVKFRDDRNRESATTYKELIKMGV